MASAWGYSWGRSWGNAWGSVSSAGGSYGGKRKGKRLIVDGEFIYSDDPRLKLKLEAMLEKAEVVEPVTSEKEAQKAIRKARRKAEKPSIVLPDVEGIDPQILALLEAYQARVKEAFERGLVRRIAELQRIQQLMREDEEILLLMGY